MPIILPCRTWLGSSNPSKKGESGLPTGWSMSIATMCCQPTSRRVCCRRPRRSWTQEPVARLWGSDANQNHSITPTQQRQDYAHHTVDPRKSYRQKATASPRGTAGQTFCQRRGPSESNDKLETEKTTHSKRHHSTQQQSMLSTSRRLGELLDEQQGTPCPCSTGLAA